MKLEQRIDTLTLRQLLIVAAVLAFVLVAWYNRDLIIAKLKQP